jgi:hypothetical protein
MSPRAILCFHYTTSRRRNLSSSLVLNSGRCAILSASRRSAESGRNAVAESRRPGPGLRGWGENYLPFQAENPSLARDGLLCCAENAFAPLPRRAQPRAGLEPRGFDLVNSRPIISHSAKKASAGEGTRSQGCIQTFWVTWLPVKLVTPGGLQDPPLSRRILAISTCPHWSHLGLAGCTYVIQKSRMHPISVLSMRRYREVAFTTATTGKNEAKRPGQKVPDDSAPVPAGTQPPPPPAPLRLGESLGLQIRPQIEPFPYSASANTSTG